MKHTIKVLALTIPIGHLFDLLTKIVYPKTGNIELIISTFISICLYYSGHLIVKKYL